MNVRRMSKVSKRIIMCATLPTLYEYYTAGGIQTGISTNQSYFTLNNKNVTIYSGAMHYFRVPKDYWRDRLRRLRAAGLNTVETYVPWNLHEPEIGTYDFGNGDFEMSDFLDIKQFITTAQEEDLFVLVRPGPFICAEWEFGGLPSWLLREKNIKIRTSDEKFMKHVVRYFSKLLVLLATLQFTLGGPIIGFQIENEYGSTEWKSKHGSFTPDKIYLQQLRRLMIENGIVELLFTSDSPLLKGDVGTLPDLLQTANFDQSATAQFDKLKTLQPNKPTMAMEFWSGWFDHWGENHHVRSPNTFKTVLSEILNYPASVNFYMFHGGTNWGFLNGANIPSSGAIRYQPDTTSYDYDAPLSESGDYTEKYYIVKDLLERHNVVKTKIPKMPEELKKIAYPSIKIEKTLTFANIVNQLPSVINSQNLVQMELLNINNNSGQSYGYIIYRKKLNIPENAILTITGFISDSVLVLIDGNLISPPLTKLSDLNNFGYWRLENSTIRLPQKANATLELIVENWGRNNFGKLETFIQFKGLYHPVFLNKEEIKDWEILPMEFKKHWTNNLSNWSTFETRNVSLHSASLNVEELFDTYIDMRKWNTGVVIVNGFVLGRYMHIGPQQTLYLPAPLMKKGNNEIIIFEHFTPGSHIEFSKNPIFLTSS